jgi:hypothetical protein
MYNYIIYTFDHTYIMYAYIIYTFDHTHIIYTFDHTHIIYTFDYTYIIYSFQHIVRTMGNIERKSKIKQRAGGLEERESARARERERAGEREKEKENVWCVYVTNQGTKMYSFFETIHTTHSLLSSCSPPAPAPDFAPARPPAASPRRAFLGTGDSLSSTQVRNRLAAAFCLLRIPSRKSPKSTGHCTCFFSA